MYYIKNDGYNFIYGNEFQTREEAEDFAKKLIALGTRVTLTSLSQEERDSTLRLWEVQDAKKAVKVAKAKLEKARRAYLAARVEFKRIKGD